MLVMDMYFGAVPVRLLKPKELSPKLRRGIIFYHGGGAIFGSLGKKLAFEVGKEGILQRQNLAHVLLWTWKEELMEVEVGAS